MNTTKLFLTFMVPLAVCGQASAQLVKYEAKDFDRTATNQKWNFYSSNPKFSPSGEASYQGRTFWNNPREGVGDSANTDGKSNPEIVRLPNGAVVARFKLHTYSRYKLPDGKGGFENGFEGVEMFRDEADLKPPGGSFSAIARAKMQITQAPPGGSVVGFYAVTPNNAATRDEIDFEFLSSQLPGSLWLNVYKNGGQLSDVGKNALTAISFSPASSFHAYTIHYSKDLVSWHTDDVTSPKDRDTVDAAGKGRIKSEKSFVPNDDLSVHLNAWVPDRGWAEANSQALQTAANGKPYDPTNNPGGYKTYYFDVSWVQIGKGHKSIAGKGKQ